jgi:hypothetical protein
MTRKTKTISYKGDLATPIQKNYKEDAANAEFSRRFFLLLKFYEIDRSDPVAFFKLSLKLALNHVPGLQRERGRGGRSLIWTDQRLAELALAVDSIRKHGHATSDDEACKQLLTGRKSIKWKPPISYEGTTEQWRRHLKNMVLKGRKTLPYLIEGGPSRLKEIHKLFFPTDVAPLAPDENGSYLRALLKKPII